MAERVVRVKLSAQIQEYQAAMLKAAQSTRAIGTEAEKLAQKRQAFDQLGRAGLAAGGLMAAGLTLAVKKFADFDQAMSNVAATGQDARNSIQALRDAAIDAGARTVFSATESANAIEEMAKAGVDAKDILGGGLAGALDLAAAGGLGVADAAGIAATALKIFNLEGSDMSHVADLLAAGAGKAMGDVSDLSAALAQGGQVAAATGLSIEETTAALSAFASEGLLGSDAGTSLKTMLQRLTPQSKEAQKQFDALGVSAYDVNGEFVGLAEFSGQLQTALKDLTPEQRNAALAVMFGSDAVRTANVLYKEGEAGIREWTSAVNDQGYAAETAATRLDNLKGDIEALGGAFDSALITMGSAADGPLRGFVQGLTGLVDKFNELPDGAQQVVYWTGAIASAASIATGAFFLGVPKVAEYRKAIAELGPGVQKTSRLLGTLATAAAAVGAAFIIVDAAGNFVRQLEGTDKRIQELAGSNKGLGDSLTYLDEVYSDLDITSGFEGLVALQENGWSRITGLWDGAVREGADLESALGELGEGLGALAQANLPAAQAQFEKWAEATDGSKEQLTALLNAMGPYRDALVKVAQQQGIAASEGNLLKLALGDAITPTQQAAEETQKLADEAEVAAKQVEDLSDSLRNFGSPTLDAREAARDFQAAIDDASEALKKNGKTLDDNDAKGRANASALDAIAEAANRSAASIIDQTGSEEDAAEALEVGREALIKKARQFGMSKSAAKEYADSVIADMSEVKKSISDIPGAVTTKVSTSGVESAVNSLNNLRNIARDVNNMVTTVRVGTTQARADGGPIFGPGTETSDSVPAMLSVGEHVLTAAEVRAAGGHSKIMQWRAAMRAGSLPGFASGGAVVSGSELIDWRRYVRRGQARGDGMGGNGLDLVDRLFDVAAKIGGKYGQRLVADAYKSEKAFRGLEKQADAAATRLDKAKDRLADLRDAAGSMAYRVASAVRSFFNIGTVSDQASQSSFGKQTTTVDGQKYSWYDTSKPTVGSIRSGMKVTASRIKAFAGKLKKLAGMGLAPALLAEIAELGVEQGDPVADALLSGSKADIKAINDSYATINKYSNKAGDTVADANFEKLITAAEKDRDAAKKNADRIQAKLERETTRLIKGITNALEKGRTVKKAAGGPIVGPGTSTSDSIPALLSNGENVWSAAQVQAHGGQARVEQLKRLTPTAARFAWGGPVGPVAGVPSGTGGVVASKEVIQLVVDRKVLAQVIRDHDRSLS